MELIERDVDAYECSSCGRLARGPGVTCCGESMEAVETNVTYDAPEPMQVTKAVFGISSTELALCKVLMAEEQATVGDLAAEISRDKSVAMRHLDHLVELGVVEKESRVRREGGRENVYSSVPLDEIHRSFRLGLLAWLDDAEELLDELSREKLQTMIEQADSDPDEDSVREGRNSLFELLLERDEP